MDADLEFQEKPQLLLRRAEKMPVAELRNECATLRSLNTIVFKIWK